MRDNFSFIKTIKIVLLVAAVMAFGITCYQLSGSYIKGWQSSDDHTNFHTAYTFDSNYLLLAVGIITIVMMQVFKTGYELKQEQDLTV